MNKKHIRKEVIAHLTTLKQNEIDALKHSHGIYSDGADLDEESSLGYDDFAQQSQSTDSAMNLEFRIKQAEENLEWFKNIQMDDAKGIQEGNVVVTNKVNFVIGLAFKDFQWNQENFVGISTNAPIFEALSGKKEGDHFNFNGIDYTIEEIL